VVGRLQELVLELTDWCPLQCRHCSSGSGPGCRHSLAGELAMDLVRQGADLGAEQVSFGGGEPTAASTFVEVLELVASLGMAAEVFTCGVSRNGSGPKPLSGEMVRAVAAVPNAKLIFSFHGPDAELHDSVAAAPGSFECLVASLAACQDAGVRCEANFVPLRPNAASFAQLVEYWSRTGVRRASVLRFVPQGRGLENREALELTPEEETAFLAELVRLRRTTGVAIRTGSPFNGVVPGNRVPCPAGSSKIVVQPDGNVIPCEVFKHEARRDWRLSVYDATLEECLASPGFVALREGLARGGSRDCPVHAALRAERDGVTANGLTAAVAV
jgi:MoaA/NifB/PqqE/SkfB family radical SAM enzyme